MRLPKPKTKPKEILWQVHVPADLAAAVDAARRRLKLKRREVTEHVLREFVAAAARPRALKGGADE